MQSASGLRSADWGIVRSRPAPRTCASSLPRIRPAMVWRSSAVSRAVRETPFEGGSRSVLQCDAADRRAELAVLHGVAATNLHGQVEELPLVQDPGTARAVLLGNEVLSGQRNVAAIL